MSSEKKPLLDVDLESIMGRMGGPAIAQPRSIRTGVRGQMTSFESHPLYRQMVEHRRYGSQAQFEDPHYRLHDGAAGATTSIDGVQRLNFASYDYLGLNCHPLILDAVSEAGRKFGTSVSASRISAGERTVHSELETALAGVYEAEAAIAFVSGHGAIVSTLATLMGPKDLIIFDALSHNCIVMGAKLAGAARRSFPHNDFAAVDAILEEERARFERVMIISEGLFSMDGDGPDLAKLIEVKRRHGAIIMIDDAHGLGVLGQSGRGIFEHQGVNPLDVDLWAGTLSKALVSCGGYVAGSRVVIDILKHHAPGFVYSVGLPAGVAVAATTALKIMFSEPERVAALQARSRRFHAKAISMGLDVASSWGVGIIPVIVGDPVRTVALSQRLLERDINTFPVLPPGVPDGSARIRFFISAAHAEEQIDHTLETFVKELDAVKAVSVAQLLGSPSASRP